MIEHLQECWATYPSDPPAWCICDELRACEQRVQKIAYEQGLGAGSDEHRQHEVGFVKGYAAALDAAREAVLGAGSIDVASGRALDGHARFVWMGHALAAIDALREKP